MVTSGLQKSKVETTISKCIKFNSRKCLFLQAVLAGLFMAAASNARPQQFEDLSLQPIKLDLGTPEGKSSDPTFGTADYVDVSNFQ